MKLLVTGADGLLGSNLVRELLKKDYSVRVLIFPGSTSRTLEGLDVERVEGDLGDEEFFLSMALSGCDGVFHCAAITDFWTDPDLIWRVNVDGTRRLLDACLSASIKRLVFVGSASSYEGGRIDQPGDESGGFPEVYRDGCYQMSKHEASELVRQYVRKHGLDAVIVAPTYLLGSYDSRPSGGEIVLSFIQKNLKVSSPGGRSFAHASDVAKAMISAFENGGKGETYILGGENLDFHTFFCKVASIAGKKPPKLTLPKALILLTGEVASLYEKLSGKKLLFNRKMARYSIYDGYYSSKKAIEELGMVQTPVEDAIIESIRSLKEYGHLES